MPANDPAALLIDASVWPHFPSHSPLLLPPGELLPGSHPADEDKPNLLLVPGLPVLSALRPPGGAVPAEQRRPPVRHRDQRLRRGHGREEQLLRGVSHQLEDQTLDQIHRRQRGLNPSHTRLLQRLLLRAKPRKWKTEAATRGEDNTGFMGGEKKSNC